jgi:hypothetical protein
MTFIRLESQNQALVFFISTPKTLCDYLFTPESLPFHSPKSVFSKVTTRIHAQLCPIFNSPRRRLHLPFPTYPCMN